MLAQPTLRGVVGQVKHSYLTAAVLRDYLVTRDPSGAWTLTATVVHRNPFLLTQTPLVFVAPHKRGAWRWPVTSIAVTEGRLQAWLGVPL